MSDLKKELNKMAKVIEKGEDFLFFVEEISISIKEFLKMNFNIGYKLADFLQCDDAAEMFSANKSRAEAYGRLVRNKSEWSYILPELEERRQKIEKNLDKIENALKSMPKSDNKKNCLQIDLFIHK